MFPSSTVPSSRKSPQWVEDFLLATQDIKSPPLYRRWAAISAISGALARRCWAIVQHQAVYPNLYVMLVGPSGGGKSQAIKNVRTAMPNGIIHIAPNKVTPEKFLMRLGRMKGEGGWGETEANPRYTEGGTEIPIQMQHTVTVMSEELGNFLTDRDSVFMDVLTELYDCPEVFEKETKTSGDDKAECVAVTICGGVTPDRLSEILPENAFFQGFASRIILVHAEDRSRKPLFPPDTPNHLRIMGDLQADLLSISALRGQFDFTREAAEQLDAWYQGGMKPMPDHPRLVSYNERRHLHLIKLCMIVSAAQRNDLTINLDDLTYATTTLLEVEREMPTLFPKIGGEPTKLLFDEVAVLVKAWMDTHPATNPSHVGLPEDELRRYLVGKVKVTEIARTIEEMCNGGWLEAFFEKPRRRFMPGPKYLV